MGANLFFELCRCQLFVIFQRRNFHQGAFGIGAMHRLAVVAQSLLRKTVPIIRIVLGWGLDSLPGLPFNLDWFSFGFQ